MEKVGAHEWFEWPQRPKPELYSALLRSRSSPCKRQLNPGFDSNPPAPDRHRGPPDQSRQTGLCFIPLRKSANRDLVFEQRPRLGVRTLAQLVFAPFGLQQAIDGG